MKARVFVFEDNDTLRSMLCSLLESRGYEVMCFSEPGLCPMYLERGCPCPHDHACADIIITDINMPNVTGLEFLENRIQNGCKVGNRAVMSGGWTDEELEHAERLGCRIFEKPFKFDELMKWLNECEKKIDPDRKLLDLAEGDLGRESQKR